MGKRLHLQKFLGILLSTTLATPAFAEEASGPQGSNAPIPGEIIVTAQKRSESVQRVAASITAISGDALADRAVGSPAQLAGQIPGLEAGEYGPTMQFAIRGVSLDIKTGAGEPSVALHVDGVYLARPTMPFIDFEDVERVEVLRGPQGTLYGRNATGGAINFISAEPTNELEGYVTVGAGSFNRLFTRGSINLPLADGKAALRLTGSYDEDDGYARNLTNNERLEGRKRTYVHGALRLQPAETLQLDLGAYYIREVIKGPVQYNMYQGPFFEMVFPDETVLYTNEPWKVYENEDALNNSWRRLLLFTGRVSWDISDSFTLRSITGYADSNFATQFSADGTTLAYTPVGTIPQFGLDRGDSNTFSQELNLAGSAGPVDFIAGLYYFHEHFRPYVPINFPSGLPGALPPGASFLGIADEKTESYAAFTDVTAHLSDRFRVVGGVRISRDRKNYVQSFGVQFAEYPNGTGPGFACEKLAQKASWSSVSPKAGVQFDVTRSAMLYGQYQRGSKAGQFNLTVCENKVNPEVVDSFEIGMKSRWLDNRLTVNLAAFRYDYKDLQVDRQIPGVPPTSILDNAATAKVEGVEFETLLLPSDDISINVGITYLNSRYGRYLPGDGNDHSGNRLNRAPRWTVKSGAEWRVPLSGFFSRFTIRGELNMSDRVYFEPSNNLLMSQRSTIIGNAYATLDSDLGGWSLKGYVTNIGDVAAMNGIINTLASQNAVLGYYNRPRTFGAELTKRF